MQRLAVAARPGVEKRLEAAATRGYASVELRVDLLLPNPHCGGVGLVAEVLAEWARKEGFGAAVSGVYLKIWWSEGEPPWND